MKIINLSMAGLEGDKIFNVATNKADPPTKRMYRIPATGSGHEMKPPGTDLLNAFQASPDLVPVEMAPGVVAMGMVSKVSYPNLLDEDPLLSYDNECARDGER